MNCSKHLAPTCVAAALFVFATVACGQESTTRGFTIGLHASGASLAVEGEDRNNAGGGGIHLGIGVNRRITIIAQLDGAQFDEQSTGDVDGNWTLGHFDLGVRFNFANSLRKWVPFLQGTLGLRAVTVQDPVVNSAVVNEVSISGPALTLGGGIDYYFSQRFALDVQLLWSGGEFTTLRVDNVSVGGFGVNANSTRFNIGVAWWP